jgi:hypothetical protein
MQQEGAVQSLCQMVKEVLSLEITQIYHRIIENSRGGRWVRKVRKGFGNDYILVVKQTLHKN